jgi:hypothetical protein
MPADDQIFQPPPTNFVMNDGDREHTGSVGDDFPGRNRSFSPAKAGLWSLDIPHGFNPDN